MDTATDFLDTRACRTCQYGHFLLRAHARTVDGKNALAGEHPLLSCVSVRACDEEIVGDDNTKFLD